jgi:hypothetical protein
VTSSSVAIRRVEALKLVATAILRSVVLITVATLLILTLLPAALGAAGPQVPIVG